MKCITLLTDFGTRDPYLAAMKGVIASIHPNARVIDISHEVGPQNVAEASFLLLSVYPFFPKGTIHVVVVDPGVGSPRKILCMRTRDYFFLAPDNGILGAVIEQEKDCVIRSVENKALFLKEVSSTFHGRDIMAPVAAHLSRNDIFAKLGPKIAKVAGTAWPEPKLGGSELHGRVIHIDRYGNLFTNISSRWQKKIGVNGKVLLGARKVARVSRYYSQGKPKELIALWNSSGYLELACFLGSAKNLTGATVGTRVRVTWDSQ